MKRTAGFLVALSLLSAGLAIPAHADDQSQDSIPVHIFESVSNSLIPTEPNYTNGNMWGLNTSFGINEQGALDLTSGSRDVVVGFIDTGITNHTDLNANVVAGYDFISGDIYNSRGAVVGHDYTATGTGDGNGRDSDPSDPGDYTSTTNSSWHGTHVAGIIGALANGEGALGVAPIISLMPLRALGSSNGSLLDIKDAITWASGGSVSGITAVPAKRADVISLSLGGTGSACPTSLQSTIDAAVGRGSIVVVAAGNDGVDLANTFPANCQNVIVVMASDVNGAKTSWSNFVVAGAANSIYVTTPGSSIYSTYNAGTRTPGAQTFALMSGTSMATPFASGIVALIRSVKPTATFSEIKSLLTDPNNVTSGVGGVKVLNAGKIISAAIGAPAPVATPEAIPEPAPAVTETPAPVVAPAPIVVAPPFTLNVKKKFSGKNFAAQAGVTVPKKSTVSLKVVGSKSSCKIKSGKLATLKVGSCVVAVKVVTKVKVGKKYKKQTTTTNVDLVVA